MAIKEPGIAASPNRGLALAAGTMFAVWGMLGYFFAADHSHDFVATSGGYLWDAFEVNIALATVWVLIAAYLFITGLGTVAGARSANRVVGIISVLLGVYGFVFMNTGANFFAANTTDNVFHVIVGVVLLLTALGADRGNIAAVRASGRRA